MLEFATRDAEALVFEARDEADQALAHARAEAAEAIQTCARRRCMPARKPWPRWSPSSAIELDRVRTRPCASSRSAAPSSMAQVDRLSEFEDRSAPTSSRFFREQLETLAEPLVADKLVVHSTEHPQAS